jgi:hypothetical protein
MDILPFSVLLPQTIRPQNWDDERRRHLALIDCFRIQRDDLSSVVGLGHQDGERVEVETHDLDAAEEITQPLARRLSGGRGEVAL